MKLDSLDPAFQTTVEQVIKEVSEATGLTWIATSCRRAIKEQDALYAQGRTAPGAIVTRAKGGQSPHNFGLAVDCVPLKDGDTWWSAPEGFWSAYGAIAKNYGLVWGGDFKSILDLPHIEAPDWRDTQLAWKEGQISVT